MKIMNARRHFDSGLETAVTVSYLLRRLLNDYREVSLLRPPWDGLIFRLAIIICISGAAFS